MRADLQHGRLIALWRAPGTASLPAVLGADKAVEFRRDMAWHRGNPVPCRVIGGITGPAAW